MEPHRAVRIWIRSPRPPGRLLQQGRLLSGSLFSVWFEPRKHVLIVKWKFKCNDGLTR